MKNNYPKTYQLISSLVSNDLDNLHELDDADRKELASCLIKDDADILAESVVASDSQRLLGEFIAEGLDYAIALQEVLTMNVLEVAEGVIEELFEDAKNQWLSYFSQDAANYYDVKTGTFA